MRLDGYYNLGGLMKMWIKKNGGILLIVLLSFLPGFLFWNELPAHVPSYWGINGNVDGTMTRLNAAIFGPLINLVFFLFFLFLPRIDPKKENYIKFTATYNLFRWLIHLLLTVLQVIVIWNAVLIFRGGHALNIATLLPPILGLLFVILGNYTTRVRPNYFIGIRTPWTLADEHVWERTNRFGGRVFVIAGLIGILSFFFPGTLRFYIFLIPLLFGVVITVIYSYTIYTNKR
jgi:uncharacterized membrane protein